MAIPIVRPGQGGESPRKRPEASSGGELPPIKMGRSDAPAVPRKKAPSTDERPRRAMSSQGNTPQSRRPSAPSEEISREARPSSQTPRKRPATREEYLAQKNEAPRGRSPQGESRSPRPAKDRVVRESARPSQSAGAKKKRPDPRVQLEKGEKPQRQQRRDPRGDWVVDSKTGVKHRVLPKTEWDPESPGYSVSHIEDSYDANYDLDSMAKDFLGHLRVAPSKKELAELQAEKEAMKRQQDEAYHELHDDDEEDEEYDYYDED